jgi:HSP20 family molecular chaperone IbpA
MKDLVKYRGVSPARRGWGSLFDWDPFEDLRSDFFNVFNDAVSYLDDDKNLVVELEVPGFTKDNLDIELANGVLSINGKREVKTECYVGRKEISKRYRIGDFQDATATVNDGILKVVIKTPSAETKKVEVT